MTQTPDPAPDPTPDPVAAATALVATADGGPPPVGACRRAVWLLIRHRRFDPARALLDGLAPRAAASRKHREELAALDLELRLHAQRMEGIDPLLAALAATHPGSAVLRALAGVAHMMRGRPDTGLALLRAAPPLPGAALERAFRLWALLTPADRLALTEHVMAEHVMAGQAPSGWDPGLKGATARMAETLLAQDRPDRARALLDRAMAAEDGPPAARLRLLAARAAWLDGDRAAAGAQMAALLAEVQPPLGRAAQQTLALMLKDSVPPARLALAAGALDPAADPAADPDTAPDPEADFAPGFLQRRIDAWLARPADAPFSGADFMRFFLAARQMNRYDLVREALLALPAGAALSLPQWLRLLRFTDVFGDPAIRDAVRARLFAALDPASPPGILARLMLLPDGPGLEAAAADALAHLESGRRAWELRFLLAEDWEGLRPRLTAPAVVRGLARQVAHVFDPDAEGTNRALVAAQRHLCRTVLGAMPDPKPGLVSVLTPCHRAADLPNLRRCISWQTWPDIELIVVANGPLAEDPRLEALLADLPVRLTLLRGGPGRVGRFLNMAIEAATGDHLLRFDSDDLYFPDYIANTLRAMQASGADIAGKAARFYYSEALDRMFFAPMGPRYLALDRGELRSHSGSTISFTRAAARDLRFHEEMLRASDNWFYDTARRQGLRLFTLDPFDHVVTRRAEKSAHTSRLAERVVSTAELLPLGGRAVLGDAASGAPPDPAALAAMLPLPRDGDI